MKAITSFINELRRSEWYDDTVFANRRYNGIRVVESGQTFYNVIEPLYNEAVIELMIIPYEKLGVLFSLIEEVEELQSCFDMPSDELLKSLMRDYKNSGNRRKSIKEDYEYLSFVKECMKIQKQFLAKFKKKLSNSSDNSDNVIIERNEEINKPIEVIKGVKGLAIFLNKGTTTAQAILNCGILQKEGIAYRVGNGWNINTEKLSQLLAKNPDLLAKRGKYQA